MIYINLLIIFLIIVFIHELGHYLVARFFNAHVTDFSIGFGKPFYQFKDRNNTVWKIAPIPLGGYVKIKGLDSIFSKNSISESGSFQTLSLFKKICVLLAGSVFNIISAWFVLFIIFFFFGITTFLPIIGSVMENSAASINDLQKGDKIIEINQIKISDFQDIPMAIGNSSSINIIVERNNKIINKNFDLIFNKDLNKYIIGISSSEDFIIKKYNIYESLKNSLLFIPNYYISSINFLKKSYNENTLSNQLAGPIGIVKMADQMKLNKIKGVLLLFIVISLFVGLFNLLPIPLLDGGHIMYFIISRIFSNSLPEFVTRMYLVVGIAIISFLFIVVTFNDIFYK